MGVVGALTHVQEETVIVGQLIKKNVRVANTVVEQQTVGIQGMCEGCLGIPERGAVGKHRRDDTDNIEGEDQDHQYNGGFCHQGIQLCFFHTAIPPGSSILFLSQVYHEKTDFESLKFKSQKFGNIMFSETGVLYNGTIETQTAGKAGY